jgi:hypothetical protein
MHVNSLAGCAAKAPVLIRRQIKRDAISVSVEAYIKMCAASNRVVAL